MIRMDEALEEARLRAKMLLQVHDELVFEVPDEEVDDDDPGDPPRDGERRRAGGEATRAAAGGCAGGGQLGRGALTEVRKA